MLPPGCCCVRAPAGSLDGRFLLVGFLLLQPGGSATPTTATPAVASVPAGAGAGTAPPPPPASRGAPTLLAAPGPRSVVDTANNSAGGGTPAVSTPVLEDNMVSHGLAPAPTNSEGTGAVPTAGAPDRLMPGVGPAEASGVAAVVEDGAIFGGASEVVGVPAEAIDGLVGMGFSRESVVAALLAASNNAERAVEMLLSGEPIPSRTLYCCRPCFGAPPPPLYLPSHEHLTFCDFAGFYSCCGRIPAASFRGRSLPRASVLLVASCRRRSC
jgi:hypothetical protein